MHARKSAFFKDTCMDSASRIPSEAADVDRGRGLPPRRWPPHPRLTTAGLKKAGARLS